MLLVLIQGNVFDVKALFGTLLKGASVEVDWAGRRSPWPECGVLSLAAVLPVCCTSCNAMVGRMLYRVVPLLLAIRL